MKMQDNDHKSRVTYQMIKIKNQLKNINFWILNKKLY